MILIYYDEISEEFFFNLQDLAEHYEDNTYLYEYSPLPREVYICNPYELSLGKASDIADDLIDDLIESTGNKSNNNMYSDKETNAYNLFEWALEKHYHNTDDHIRIPKIKNQDIADLQKSIDIFVAINKPFWKLGGNCKLGLCILEKGLREFEIKNADKYRLWWVTNNKVVMTDRVWQSFKMKNWALIDGDWIPVD